MSTVGSFIRLLPRILIDQIAAGEIVNSPAAIVKELLENSIDAQAKQCSIETVETPGRESPKYVEKITVVDDGEGIPPEEIGNSVLKHATSKIRAYDDLAKLQTFGFRGEALAAIAAVSHLTISSRQSRHSTGVQLQARGGKIEKSTALAWPIGTTISVEDIFFNIPVRKKHLRNKRHENQKIEREIVKLALAYPSVAIRYVRNTKTVFRLNKVTSVAERISQLFDKDLHQQLREINFIQKGQFTCHGFIGTRNCYRPDRKMQFEFVNERCVEIRHFSFLVKQAYDVLLPKGCFPVYFLFFEIDPSLVDVNISPQKKEVSISNEISFGEFFSSLKQIIHPRKIMTLVTDRQISLKHSHSLENKITSRLEGKRNLDHAIEQNSKGTEFRANTDKLPLERIHQTIKPNMIGASRASRPQENNDHSLSNLQQRKQTSATDGLQQNRFTERTVQRSFGVIYGTYILTEIDNVFTMIDQHAAHERINYEKIAKSMMDMEPPHIQSLLKSIEIKASNNEISQILNAREKLRDFGYDIDVWEDNLALRTVPVYCAKDQPEASELLSFLLRACKMDSRQTLFEDFIASKACKASIKKNDPISDHLIPELLEQLFSCHDPTICPHGRPTMIQMDQKALDRLFGRTE